MTMERSYKLDAFLQFNEYDVLQNGKVLLKLLRVGIDKEYEKVQ